MLQNLDMTNGIQNLSNLKENLINMYTIDAAKEACDKGYL